jgi:glycosyltransferase involved in cell wall biosynthesis
VIITISCHDARPQRAVGPCFDSRPKEVGISPDFLVIIPTFRREKYLRQALRSVLMQQEIAAIVIVVGDSPEQSAESIVREFADPRIIYRRNSMPTGGTPGIVRHLGISYARANQTAPDLVRISFFARTRSSTYAPSTRGRVVSRATILAVSHQRELSDAYDKQRRGSDVPVITQRKKPCALMIKEYSSIKLRGVSATSPGPEAT